jgi:outer membrane protein assembly factor BamB
MSGTNILAASHDNFVYSLVSRNGNIVWKRRLAGRASYLVAFMDQYALMSSNEDQGAAIVDLSNGKVAGQLIFGDGETLVAQPIVSGGRIWALTARSVYAYSLSGCPDNKEGSTAKMP